VVSAAAFYDRINTWALALLLLLWGGTAQALRPIVMFLCPHLSSNHSRFIKKISLEVTNTDIR
jgi:hypothetical protein